MSKPGVRDLTTKIVVQSIEVMNEKRPGGDQYFSGVHAQVALHPMGSWQPQPLVMSMRIDLTPEARDLLDVIADQIRDAVEQQSDMVKETR